jgi:hypothetical protein
MAAANPIGAIDLLIGKEKAASVGGLFHFKPNIWDVAYRHLADIFLAANTQKLTVADISPGNSIR